jgi:hypothetical protein
MARSCARIVTNEGGCFGLCVLGVGSYVLCCFLEDGIFLRRGWDVLWGYRGRLGGE